MYISILSLTRELKAFTNLFAVGDVASGSLHLFETERLAGHRKHFTVYQYLATKAVPKVMNSNFVQIKVNLKLLRLPF